MVICLALPVSAAFCVVVHADAGWQFTESASVETLGLMIGVLGAAVKVIANLSASLGR